MLVKIIGIGEVEFQGINIVEIHIKTGLKRFLKEIIIPVGFVKIGEGY